MKPLDLTPHFFNTETRRKEPLHTQQPGCVKMYTCGPTIYNFAHIGNFRTYVFEDLLRRTLKFLGFQVEQVMNLTDIDDKTIRGALKEKITLQEFTEPFKEAFFEDLQTLGIEKVEHYPAATDYIGKMIVLIQDLMDKKIAYQGGDKSIYFSIRAFPRYGCLSHLNLSELKAGASERIATDEYEKETVADFVLWKAHDEERDGPIFWESPFGPGRPGWHIECSAMAMSLLGETVDIHVGGVDNIFPHHENEIAQSEACTGKRFVKHWMHAEHLLVDGKKMSKSLGNFYTLRDLLKKGFSRAEVRFMLLNTHYRTQLNFTLQGMEASRGALARIKAFIIRIQEVAKASEENIDANTYSSSIQADINEFMRKFSSALADDLNMPQALAALFDLIHLFNAMIDEDKISSESAQLVLDALNKINLVLNFLPLEEEDIPQAMQDLLQKRIQARQEKNYQEADRIRAQIDSAGYLIEDTPHGARLRKKS